MVTSSPALSCCQTSPRSSPPRPPPLAAAPPGSAPARLLPPALPLAPLPDPGSHLSRKTAGRWVHGWSCAGSPPAGCRHAAISPAHAPGS